MRASSAATREAGRKVLKDGVPSAWQQMQDVASDLFSVADLVKQNPGLARALTDPARSAEDKVALAKDVFSEKTHPLAQAILNELVSGRFSSENDLSHALEDIASDGQFYWAASEGKLEQVAQELFNVTQLLQKERELRNALSDSSESRASRRAQLVQTLFAHAVSPQALTLLQRASAYPREGSLLATLRRYAQRASQLRDRKLVTVEAPQELEPAQLERLHNILRNRYGRDVDLNVSIVPSLIGGLRIHTSSHITDGTVRNALARTLERLAG